MRNSKLRYPFALCLSLSLGGLTACDLEVPKPGEEGEKKSVAQKVIETATGLQQRSGTMELRLVEAEQLSARLMPGLNTSDMEAEITVKAIAVRRCVPDAEVGKDKEDDQSEEKPAQNEEPKASSDEKEDESSVQGREGEEKPPVDKTLEDGKPDPAFPSPELEKELEEKFKKFQEEQAKNGTGSDKDAPPIKEDHQGADEKPKLEHDDTVASDEELAEEGDNAKTCQNGQWVVLKQDALKIDLLNLANMDAGGLLAKGKLPVGTYRGIRLMIEDAKVRMGDHEVSLKIPSGKSAGLKIRAGFDVEEDGQVDIDLGFDLEGSLRQHRKHGWMLKPVLRAKKK